MTRSFNQRLAVSLVVTATMLLGGARVMAEPPTVRIGRVRTPPKLDDFVNGTIPDGYTAVNDFRQREPGDATPASRETTAYLAYDDRDLHVIFVCRQDRAALRANLTKREGIFGDDIVGVLLDTYRDHRRAYVFLSNPLGIQMDGITTEGQDDDWSFDTVWHTEGRDTQTGFVVWIAVPFKSLRFSDAPRQQWGVALARLIPLNNETSFWPVMTRRIQGFGTQMATLDGLERISPGRNLQFIPYAAGAAARFLDERAAQYSSRTEGRAGLDAKVVVKDAVTLDFTVNPDFSQVESDEPQVTINQRFEVFFPEKRPFFIENANMFATPENLFFSRRIVNPQSGARVTGKVGRWVVAGVASDDRAPGERADENDPQPGKRAFVGVARAQREFAEQSQIGLMATTRTSGSTSNTVVSLDTRLPLNKNWLFTGQVAVSDTREGEKPRRSGQDYDAELTYSTRNVNFGATYLDRSPGFRSDPGYIPRVDIRQASSYGRYRWYTKNRRMLSLSPRAEYLVNWNHSGRVQDWSVKPSFEVEFPANTNIGVSLSEAYELFEGRGFEKYHARASFSTDWLKWFGFNAAYRIGEDVNYYPAAGLETSLGASGEGELGFTLRPTSQLRLEETYIYNRLRTKADARLPAGPRSEDLFTLHLWRTKANYQFTRALSLRTIIDCNAVLPNSSLINLTRDKRLTADILVTYLVNPGTALYVGYNDQYANLRIDPTIPPTLRATASPSTSIGRQFFVKMSYLLRF